MGSLVIAPEPMGAVDPALGGEQPLPVVHASQKLVTVAIVAGPAIALAVVIPWLWGHAVDLSDIVLALVLYLITGFGITIGFHRLFTTAASPLAGRSRSHWPSWARWRSRDR